MNCPVCHSQIEAGADKCPHCLSDLEAYAYVDKVGKKMQTQKVTLLSFGIVGVLLVAALIWSTISSTAQKAEAKKLTRENVELTQEVIRLSTTILELKNQVEALNEKMQKPQARQTKAKTFATKESSVYLVKEGDTLWDIAGIMLGDSYQWEKIAMANNIAEPRLLQVGAKLTIAK